MGLVQWEVDHVMVAARAKVERVRRERSKVEEQRPGARRGAASRK